MSPSSAAARHLTRLLAAGALVTACARGPADRLTGRWSVDPEATVTPESMLRVTGGLAPDAATARMVAARAEAARIHVEFDAGKMVVDTGLDRQEVRFSAQAEGDSLTLETDDGHGRKDTVRCRLDDDRLRMQWGEAELVLVKR